MPNLRTRRWTTIVRTIPVDEHSVEANAEFWLPHFAAAGLRQEHAAIFGGNASVRISRGRLLTHRYPSAEMKCLEVLLWGYPAGMRGNGHKTYLANVTTIAANATTANAWPPYYSSLAKIGRLGISTITKLAYFFHQRFEGLDAVILDQRIIDVVAGGRWPAIGMPALTYANARGQYVAYLKLMNSVASSLKARPDQLEFVLFSMGATF